MRPGLTDTVSVAGVVAAEAEIVSQGVPVPCTAAVNGTEAGLLEMAMACCCGPPPNGAAKNTGLGAAVSVPCACRLVTPVKNSMLRRKERTQKSVVFKVFPPRRG